MNDTSDSELIMGMFRVFGIDDQAWNFDSERKKSDLGNWHIITIIINFNILNLF